MSDPGTVDSEQKTKAHRTFLEVVLSDTQATSPRSEQPDDQEKKAAHVARLEAMIKMADTPETSEFHKTLTAELARVTKTVKSPPNSVKLERKMAWIAREERRLSATGGRYLQSHGSLENSESGSPRGKESRRCPQIGIGANSNDG